MRHAAWLALFFVLAACDEQPRQFLVELKVEEPLVQALSVVQLDALNREGEVLGKSQQLSLTGPELADGVVTFGAIPASDGHLTLRARGLDSAGVAVLEQIQEADLGAQRKTRLSMLLLAECLGKSLCSDGAGQCFATSADMTSSCDGGVPDSATPLDAEVQVDAPSCDLENIHNCGECGIACNTDHVYRPTCEMAQCMGTCDDDFGDCDKNLKLNGCEVDFRNDAQNCNGCGLACPYGVCVKRHCERKCEGSPTVVTNTKHVRLPPNRMIGVQIEVKEEGFLAGLGVNIQRGATLYDTKFRMALYSSNSAGMPDLRVAETAQTSVHALRDGLPGALNDCGSPHGLEMKTPNEERLTRGTYWFFLIANEDLFVDVIDFQEIVVTSQEDVNYTAILQMPAHPPLLTSDYQPVLAAYLVRTPIH